MTDFVDVLTAHTLRRLGGRVTDINETTRDRIRDLTIRAVNEGTSPAELGRVLRGVVDPLASDKIGNDLARRLGSFGSELRGETIARTEMRVAQNAAQIDSFRALGADMVELIDGDQDPECAARNGRIVPLAEAESLMFQEHPNGTLTFAPVVGGEQPPVPVSAPPTAPGPLTARQEVPVTAESLDSLESLQRYLGTRHGVEIVTTTKGWEASHYQSVARAFDDVERAGIPTRGLVREVRFIDVRPGDPDYPKDAHPGAAADMNKETREMRIFPRGRDQKTPFGIGETLGDKDVLRNIATHEIGHAVEAQYSGLTKPWTRIWNLHRDMDPARFRTQIEETRKALDTAREMMGDSPGGGWDDIVKAQERHLRQLEDGLREALKTNTEARVSEYGDVAHAEDLADAFYAYVKDRAWLRSNYPQRADLFDSVLGD